MSSLIEQAILDAKELKEAAIKNAEQLIIEKYANEIKSNLEQLLEQDLGAMPAIPAAPAMPGTVAPSPPPVDPAKAKADKDKVPNQLEYAAFDGMTIGKTKYADLNEEVEIDLTSLTEYELNPEKGPTKRNLQESFDISEEALQEMLSDLDAGGADYMHEEEELEEEMTGMEDTTMPVYEEDSGIIDPLYEEEEGISTDDDMDLMSADDSMGDLDTDEGGESDSLLASLSSEEPEEEMEDISAEIAEALKIDYNENYIAGRDYGLGANTAEDTHTLMLSNLYDEVQEKEKENKELKEQNESLKKKLAEAGKLISDAHKQHSSIKESFHSMKGKLAEVQLMNAKLLYSNKVLTDASLNERQKNKIVESLSTADSLEKVKIVYETLQSAVEDNTSWAPKSLSEAVSKRSSSLLIKANRKEDRDANPVSETLSRMKILAGINK